MVGTSQLFLSQYITGSPDNSAQHRQLFDINHTLLFKSKEVIYVIF